MKLTWTKVCRIEREHGEYTIVWKCRERPLTIESRHQWTLTWTGKSIHPWYYLINWDGTEEWYSKLVLAKNAAQRLEDRGLIPTDIEED